MSILALKRYNHNMETDLPFCMSCELESLQEDSSPRSQLMCMEVLQSGLTCFENIFAELSAAGLSLVA